MKLRTNFLLILAVVLFSSQFLLAEDTPVDKLVVPWSNPGQPGLIEAGLINGGITVEGYGGKEVIIEARMRMQEMRPSKSQKAEGMLRIPVTATGLSVEEENNQMEISVSSHRRTIDLTIKVPFKTSLNLSCVNAGDILVKNIEGELDINNINGAVNLENISGAVLAHALNKNLTVTFKKILPDKAMSFSTLNGAVDVTFPANVKAELKMKTDNGEIYTDFKVDIKPSNQRMIEENKRSKAGKYQVQIDKSIIGTINGGGPEFQFTSFNGDIFIRKASK